MMLTSSICKRADFREPWFAGWEHRLGETGNLHRKVWEWAVISQALFERDMLRSGRKGIGFAVGHEPLSSLFASFGAEIDATDLFEGETAELWASTGQHAAGLDALYKPNIIDEAGFKERVNFASADMTDLSAYPSEAYDFLWSSCAIEHLGSLDNGLQHVKDAMRLLKPGGIACHTTEINISSLDDTVFDGIAVIYRECDIRKLSAELRKICCVLSPMNFDPGSEPEDVLYDTVPHYQSGRAHLKLEMFGFVCTSSLLICQKFG